MSTLEQQLAYHIRFSQHLTKRMNSLEEAVRDTFGWKSHWDQFAQSYRFVRASKVRKTAHEAASSRDEEQGAMGAVCTQPPSHSTSRPREDVIHFDIAVRTCPLPLAAP